MISRNSENIELIIKQLQPLDSELTVYLIYA